MYILHLINSDLPLYKYLRVSYHVCKENIKKVCVIMIQPVNALTPKVFFRGDAAVDSREAAKKQTQKRLALINAGGISLILGAATTAIARSNTSSWRHAGYFGLGAAAVSMMFLGPGFLYKAGINTTKTADKDVLAKEKKLIPDVGEISNVAKNTTKATIKSMPKV